MYHPKSQPVGAMPHPKDSVTAALVAYGAAMQSS